MCHGAAASDCCPGTWRCIVLPGRRAPEVVSSAYRADIFAGCKVERSSGGRNKKTNKKTEEEKMKIFQLNERFSVVCAWQKTRYGFRHTATLISNGMDTGNKTKCCYYNRTWESYEYQSVLHQAINKFFDDEAAKAFIEKVDAEAHGEFEKAFMPYKMMAALADICGSNTEEKNAMKKRSLEMIPGIEFPDDFDRLSEEEKERRLTGALKQL